ncbi:YunC family protein [Ferroacidibacillus organovorans]|uniref:DUF1805 domain-containing protein n=1 Tax=Ferroacidibacillus organovorans TaxID=1765683 RepID=A0A1V4EX86_9BACL|nr:DUF1805 domain-containing protein [Ferroacidibacillus organovorans]OPG17546.1 hypothetical protein B2M26_00865 [Ferroacidibacillus organovorans]
MVTISPITLSGTTFIAVTVDLPKTRLVTIQNEVGYIMCGALDVELLNTKLNDRKILAGRAVGVRTVEDLLSAPLEAVTDHARTIGVTPGMKGEDALLTFAAHHAKTRCDTQSTSSRAT